MKVVICTRDSNKVLKASLSLNSATQIQKSIISLTFSGDITDEGKVLDWLISNRATGDEAERLEEVTLSALEGMTSSKDGIAVLFCE